MLFWILLVSLIVATIVAGMLGYTAQGFNKEDNASAASASTLMVGGLICFLILLGASSGAVKDTNRHIVKEEKTYAVAESSIPTYEKGKLSFTYVENGKLFPYDEPVDSFNVGMEKPKAFKITKYDVVDHSIIPWVIMDGTKIEVIK